MSCLAKAKGTPWKYPPPTKAEAQRMQRKGEFGTTTETHLLAVFRRHSSASLRVLCAFAFAGFVSAQ
jgi:hypothetical protein